MSKFLAVTSAFILGSFQPAFGEDWSGQTPPPTATGSIGPLTGGGILSSLYVIRCQPGSTLPPCGAGQRAAYFLAGDVATNLSSIPAAAGPGSNVGVVISGAYADPTSPTGLSNIGGEIPLDAFAKSLTVNGLATQVSGLATTVNGWVATANSLAATANSLAVTANGLAATANGLAAQIQTVSSQLDQLQQRVESQDNSLRQGVAISLALAGTGDIDPGEKVSLSMNWGTFGGQNAVGGGITFRASEHVVLSGGVGAGFRGGLIGGRAGARVGW